MGAEAALAVDGDRPDEVGRAHGEPLKYLVYASVETRPMLSEDRDSILATARRRNADCDITGLLLYRDGSFTQFLEGPPAEIDALMTDIIADDRHGQVRILITHPATERSFADWRMGFRIPDAARPPGTDGVRDSLADLTGGTDGAQRRRAAQDVTTWFKDVERAGA